MNVRIDSTVAVTSSLFANGVAQSATEVLGSGAANVTCMTGGCVVAPPLTLPGLGCVAGTVQTAAGAPIAGRTVRVSTGGADTSELDGSFCLAAPAEVAATLFASAIPPQTATTSIEGTSCGTPGGCTQVTLQEPAGGTQTCLSGRVVDGFGSDALRRGAIIGGDPISGATVQAFTDFEELIGTAVTDANGEFCISGVESFSGVFLSVSGPVGTPCFGFQDVNDTGPAGGTCTNDDCTPVGDIGCFFGES